MREFLVSLVGLAAVFGITVLAYITGARRRKDELERLRLSHGPRVQRGVDGEGKPVMGSMREAWQDAQRAASVEAQEADRLRVKLAQARQVLSGLQWMKVPLNPNNTTHPQCPVCLGEQLDGGDHPAGHKPDCALMAALGLDTRGDA